MCGRFRLSRAGQLAQEFGLDEVQEAGARYNIAPGQQILAVRQPAGAPRRTAVLLRWGLVPSWAKEPSIGYKMINARAESVAEKPAFREALRQRRCLIPADGFYEWKKEGKAKRPFCITLADDSLFAFAGLWERWCSPQGTWLESCSVITTVPNALMAGIHDRMPVILPKNVYEPWLDPGFRDVRSVCKMLQSFPATGMRCYEVGSRVSSVIYDDAACAAPVERLPI